MAAQTSLTRQFTDLVTSTQMLIHREDPIPDQVFDASVLVDWVRGSGRLKTVQGGERIEVPIENGINGNRGFFAEYEAIPTLPQSNHTAAFYNWKYGATTVSYSGPELRRNSGKHALYNLVQLRVSNAKKSMMDLANARFFGDGTGDNGNAPNGLQNLIHTSPSSAAAAVGGIDPSVDSTWRNYAYTTSIADAATLMTRLEVMIPQVSRGHKDGEPSIFLTTPGVYNQYGVGVHGIERVIAEFKRGETGNRSFKRWAFKGIPIEYDFDCPANYLYALPMSYIYLYVDSAANMTPTELIRPHNQDALVGQFLWQMQLVISCRRHFGVLSNITEA